jgi:hypothetical protein
MLIELCKLLKDCPFSDIFLIILSDLNGCVQYLHDELSMIFYLVEQYSFALSAKIHRFKVIDYLDTASVDQIVLLIIHSVDVVYCFFHAGSSS